MIYNPQGFFEFSIFKKFPEIIQGISTKKFGNMKILSKKNSNPKHFLKEAQKATNNLTNFTGKLGVAGWEFVTPEQVHSGRVKKVESFGSQLQSIYPFIVNAADGIVTKQIGLSLFVTFADCFPILVYEPNKKIIGIAHAGWKGIRAQIAKNLISKMKNLGVILEDLTVGIGPGICANCYEVKKDVGDKFNRKFLAKKDGKIFLDLSEAIVQQLLNSGVRKENVEKANICVFEDENFFSYRREGEKLEGEQTAIIGLKA